MLNACSPALSLLANQSFDQVAKVLAFKSCDSGFESHHRGGAFSHAICICLVRHEFVRSYKDQTDCKQNDRWL